MILGLEHPTDGEIRFRGEPVSTKTGRAERLKFMAAVQPVFQNPFEAFNPLKKVDRYLASTARRFLGSSDRAAIECRDGRGACRRSASASPKSAAASRTSCPAASCSASPSPAP